MGTHVGFSGQKAFDANRSGVAKILNEKQIVVTVEGHHEAKDGLYDKFEGDAYELAALMTNGKYGGPRRPFMKIIKNIMQEDESVKEVIKRNMRYDKHEKGWLVNWTSICAVLENKAHEYMTTGFVQASLPPLQPESVYKRNAAGYNSPLVLYASGQLAECIVARAK